MYLEDYIDTDNLKRLNRTALSVLSTKPWVCLDLAMIGC